VVDGVADGVVAGGVVGVVGATPGEVCVAGVFGVISGVVVDGVPAGGGFCRVTSGTVAFVVAELFVVPVVLVFVEPVVPLAFIELSFDIVPFAFMPLDDVVPLAFMDVPLLIEPLADAPAVLPGEDICC
jgi:hypothetical protein